MAHPLDSIAMIQSSVTGRVQRRFLPGIFAWQRVRSDGIQTGRLTGL